MARLLAHFLRKVAISAERRNSVVAALGGVWAITADGYRQVLDCARTAMAGGAPQKFDRAGSQLPSGIGVINIHGPLSKSPSWFSEFLGGSNYQSIGEQFAAALADPSIDTIVLDIDSPGGESNGAGALAEAIYSARGSKSIIAYASGSMCSAAYWIGCAADSIVVDSTAIVGSIGARATLIDDSKMLADMGITVHELVSEQSPFKAMDASKPDDRLRMQAVVNAVADVFITDVARARGKSKGLVTSQFGRGDVLVGAAAVTAGLADSADSIGALLTKRTTTMDVKIGTCAACAKPNASYCTECWRSESVATTSLLATTGAKTAAEAMACVAAWKIAAAEVAVMREHIATVKAEAAAAEFDAIVADAKQRALLAPADGHKRNVAALSYRDKPDAVGALKSFLAALDPLVDITGARAGREPSPPGIGKIASLTADERRIAGIMGLPLAEVAKNKARLQSRAVSGMGPGDDDDDDDKDDKEAVT